MAKPLTHTEFKTVHQKQVKMGLPLLDNILDVIIMKNEYDVTKGLE